MVELIKGKIFRMSPAPNANHQRISSRIHFYVFQYLIEKKCEVFAAPFDVRLSVSNKKSDENIYTVVQPDICIICDTEKVDKQGCIGAPDLIVEILSKSTSKKDLTDKYEIYEQAGVKEYWIIHPEEQTLLIYSLVDGFYQPSKLYAKDEIISVGIFEDFKLDLSNIFEEPVV